MRRRSIILATTILSAILIPGSVAAAAPANTGPSPAEQDAMIVDFVQEVNAKTKLRLDPKDYEVQTTGSQHIVKPRNSPAVDVTVGDNSVAVATSTTPSIDGGDATAQQETRWQVQNCYGTTTDPRGVGWMFTCSQWGSMNYEGAGHDIWAFREYASCGAKEGGPDFWQVYSCTVHMMPELDSPSLILHDWMPKSTQNSSVCTAVPLTVTAGPVSAGTSVNVCEKLIPAQPTDPLQNFWASWDGKSYWDTDVRETGFLVSIGVLNGVPSLRLNWMYRFGECSIPPELDHPWCAF